MKSMCVFNENIKVLRAEHINGVILYFVTVDVAESLSESEDERNKSILSLSVQSNWL